VEITTSGGNKRVERLRAIAVANNAYDEGLGRFFSRSSLCGGSLSLYLLKRLRFADALRMGTAMLLGSWQHDKAIEIMDVCQVSVRVKRPMVKAMVDGEIETLDVPLVCRIRPRALRILVPVKLAATAEPKPIAKAIAGR
jgi:diacylglycerol kinase family enzyme